MVALLPDFKLAEQSSAIGTKSSGRWFSFDGQVKLGLLVRVILEAPYRISQCHERFWQPGGQMDIEVHMIRHHHMAKERKPIVKARHCEKRLLNGLA
ncbi:MAG: hypothetical protein ILM98_16380 [Kiritimatiellae bacterium]|nr:hypothetical protein [Kiritimatiellia bacterium]